MSNGRVYAGVQKKIDGQVHALKEYVDVEKVVLEVRGSENASKILKRIPFGPSGFQWKDVVKQIHDPDYLYIRKTLCDRGFDGFLRWVKKRYPEVKIILEIPTYPYDKELLSSVKNLPMYPAEVYYRNRLHRYVDRVATFSEDTEIFGIPAIGIQNGIHIDDHPVRPAKTDTSEIHLIAVASFQRHHGYERIIKGITEYYAQGGTRRIVLDLVGGGDECNNYRKMVEECSIQDHVVFWGPKHGEELTKIYEQADIGLGSFAFYKIGLELASSLKLREYLARGLPIIAGSRQDLFSEETFPYYLEFPNDDSSVNMNRIVDFYDRVYHSAESYDQVVRNIRNYAEDNATWKKTFVPVFDFVTSHKDS